MKIQGFDKCPSWLRDKYRESVNYTCQNCHENENLVGKLIPHRILRGNVGGLYTLYPLNHKLNNVKIICLDCHHKLHSNEFGVISH